MAKHIYIVDTCVLIHDPYAIFKFQENDVYLPLACLDDLDNLKTSKESVGWSAREVFRVLEKFDLEELRSVKGAKLGDGLGSLFVYNHEAPLSKNESPNIVKTNSDNALIVVCTALKAKYPKRKVAIVTKDMGLRMRAITWGCAAENLKHDLVDDSALNCVREFQIDTHKDWEIITGSKKNSDYRVKISELSAALQKEFSTSYPNEFYIFNRSEDQYTIGMYKLNSIDNTPYIKILKDNGSYKYSGITPLNPEQKMAMEIVSDPSIQLVNIAGKAGSGKCLNMDAPILTNNGWIRMGDINIGDKVAGSDGEFHNVTGVYPQGLKDLVKVIFSDGCEVECCKEHLWATKNEQQKDYTVKSTQEIIDTLQGHDGRKNHFIPLVKPVNFQEKKLIIDPYVLGILLGNGRITQNQVQLASADKTNVIVSELKNLNLMGKKSNSKFIPEIYKNGSVEQRIELLQGILDKGGSVSKKNKIIYSTVSDQLANDFKEIINSLGGIVKHTLKGKNKNRQRCNVLCVNLPHEIQPFKLKRKLDLIKDYVEEYYPTRYISEIIEIGQKECQCIMVDAEDHLYVTSNYVLTHNTVISLAVALDLIDDGLYDKIVFIKPLVPVGGQEIGFLPGNKDEKIMAWLGPAKDNLETLIQKKKDSSIKETGDILKEMIDDGIIEIEAMTFLQGRSIQNAIIILDESQNISQRAGRMVVERCGKDSKVILLGDLSQIENPYLDKWSCALSGAVHGSKPMDIAASMVLTKVERSKIASIASEIFNKRF